MDPITLGNTTFDPRTCVLTTPTASVKLRGRQSGALLHHMMHHANNPVSHAALLDIVWVGRANGPAAKVVKVLTQYIRDALKESRSSLKLQAVRNYGYKLVVEGVTSYRIDFSENQYAAFMKARDIVARSNPRLADQIWS